MRKKFLAVVLAAALACNTTGVSAAVQSPVAGASVFKSFGDLFKGDSDDEEDTQSDTQKNTKRSQVYSADPEAVKDSVVLDISRGNIRITGTEVSGYDTDGNPVTKTSSRYVVTGSSREHSIEIASGANANIVLSNASIIRTEAGESPIWIADDSTGDVTLTLEGTNTLQAGTGAAAIQKNCTYNGSTSKYGQLKITCGNISPSHICGADCGTLVATAGNGGAAIGGADGMGSSKINIVGGTITASGGIGAGVGGTGTKVEIGGGVIDAGTINSKDSVLNGNAILMADSVGDMKITKGVLVQNGKGTAYGDLDLTQGMIDHLVQSGGELDISDGAKVAVADGVDASKINTNGTGTIKQEQSGQSEEGSSEEGSSEEKPSEEKPADQAVASAETEAAEKEKPSLLQKAGKALAKVMGQDDGVKADEGQEEGIATVSDGNTPSGNTSGNATTTPTSAPSPTEANRRDTSTIAHVQRDGNNVAAGAHVKYGEKLIVEATVRFMGYEAVPGLQPPAEGTGNRVRCYLQPESDKGTDRNKILIGEEGLDGEPVSGRTLPVTVPVIIENIETDSKYNFIAEYTGTSLFPKSTSEPIDYIIDQGTITPETSSRTINATAGRTIRDTINLKDLEKPKNAAGVSLNGDWHWVKDDIVGDDNNSVDASIYNETLYPSSVVGAQYIYEAQFVISPDTENSKYERPSVLTITFNVNDALVDQEPEIESDPGPEKGYDEILWYNAKCKTIKIKVEGYDIFQKRTPPTSKDEWGDSSNWKSDYEVTENFTTGDYELYVRKRTGNDYGSVTVKDFNVDRTYPVITSVEKNVTGETASLQFEAVSENDTSQGSGVYRYKLGNRARLSGGMLSSPLTETEIESTGIECISDVGIFNLSNLSTQTWYDVALYVEDNARNKTEYYQRVFNAANSPVPDQATLDNQGKPTPSGNQINQYYGYVYQTDKQDMKGTVTLEARDTETGTIKSQVGVGDTITTTVKPDVTDYGTLRYSWWRKPKDGGDATRITAGAMDRPTYVVQKEDIDYMIICRVRGTNTSELGTIEGDIGPVVRQMWPEDYWPKDGEEDLENKTFSFTGNSTVIYEYSINGGEWIEIERTGFDRLTIQVGDTTVLVGNLKVRAKGTNDYLASDPPLTNDESFIGSGELGVKIEGDAYYGGTLTAVVTSEAIDPSMYSYQWNRNGQNIDNVGNTYVVQKEDIDQIIGVKISVTDYPGADNSATSARIGRRPITPEATVETKQYDGTTEAVVTMNAGGVINGDDVSVTFTSASFLDKNVGEDKSVRIVGTRLNGSDSGSYVLRQLNSEAKGTIEPRVLNLSMQAQDKVYDGTTDAVVTITAEALPGDNIQVSGTGQFADKNAGTNKTVTPKDVQITGTDAKNYTATGSTASTTANITPKAIEIESITVADKEYDGTADATITVNFNGAVDDVNYSYTAAFDSPNVGKDKRVDATIKLEGDSATNYTLANGAATGRGNIIKAYAPYDEANIPQNLTGIEGKKLSSVYIGPGFSWKDTETVMASVGRHTYPAYYNPDPSQYSAREIELEVLVQCAEHIWGEWVITTDPTKTDVGERQRICGVCGYTETEVIPRAPFIDNEDDKVGWGDIIQAINNASSGTEIPVVMNGTETLPASVQEALQGREVSLVLHMGDDISWTIRGEDITGTTLKDINMVVTLYTDNIPSDVIDAYLPNKATVQVHLAYSGEFGFVATLRIPLGDEFAGKASTLYYYNPTRERLEMMDSNKVTSDGMGRYDFTHASDYVVALDRPANVQGGDTPSGNGSVTPTAPTGTTTPGAQGGSATNGNNGNTGTTTGTNGSTAAATGTATSANGTVVSSNGAKTEDDTPIMFYLFLLLAGTAGITAGVAYRRKRKTGN